MKKFLLLISTLLLVQSLFAASGQAQDGTTYRGQFSASIGIATITSISGVSDILLGEDWKNGSRIPFSLCIYTNAPSNQYRIKFDTSSYTHKSHTFFIMRHVVHTNAYVKFRIYSKHPNNNGRHMSPAQSFPLLNLASTLDCSDSNNELVNFEIKTETKFDRESVAEALYGGLYQAPLIITVEAV